MKKYKITFVMRTGICTEITNVEIDNMEKYIQEKITIKDFITFMNDKGNETVVINLNNVLRIEFKEM